MQNTAQNQTIKIDGLIYKIGLHGKPFFHNGTEWLKSQKSAQEIHDCINKSAKTAIKKSPKKRTPRKTKKAA